MMLFRKRGLVLSLVLLLFIGACSSGGDDNPQPTDDDGGAMTFDRGAMLANWADNIIIPSYNNFLSTFTSFKTALGTFKADRSAANLQSLRTAWVDAYKSWQTISLFEIGPAEEEGLRLNINTFPTDVALVQQHITSGTYNLDLPSNRDTKGFPALDYLFNGIAADDAAIVAVYTAMATGDAHIAYVEDVVNDIETRVTTVRDAWDADFRDTFVNNDGSSASAATDRMVNDFIFYYEKFLRAGKMGIPLGVFSGVQAPTTLESFYYPNLSKDLFLEGLNTVENFFNGKHAGSAATGESLASYLVALDQSSLKDDILGQLQKARTAVTALAPFRTEIENNNPAVTMLAAYDEVQKAVALFKVDMVSAMSIAIDFVDADGD